MIASAIISGLGTAASGIMSFLNNRKAQQQAEAESARQIAYAEGKAAENPLATASAQASIGEYNRQAAETMDNARARDKVLGTNDANKTQKNVAQGYASLMSGIAGQGTARADKWNAAAEEARQMKAQGDQQRAAARNETYAALAANAANAMGGLWQDKTSTTDDPLVKKTGQGSGSGTDDPVVYKTDSGATLPGVVGNYAAYGTAPQIAAQVAKGDDPAANANVDPTVPSIAGGNAYWSKYYTGGRL